MKTVLGSPFLVVLIVAILAAVPASLNAAPTATMPGDFQGNNNGHPDASGSGTWHYMYSDNINPTLGTTGLMSYWSGVYYSPGSGDAYPDVQFDAGSVTMAPEVGGDTATRYGLIRWTSGVGGLVNVEGSWTHYWNNGDGMDVAVFADGVQKFSTLLTNGTTAFDFDVLVAPGSTVDFVVGPGAAADGSWDRAYFQTNITVVPAPAALLLAGLGTGLVGWLRRKRTL